MLETHTKEIVKSTVPLLKEYGEDITKVFIGSFLVVIRK